MKEFILAILGLIALIFVICLIYISINVDRIKADDETTECHGMPKIRR